MKSFWSLFVAVFLLSAGLHAPTVEAAKRFGSGGFGKSFSSAPAQKKSQPSEQQANRNSADNTAGKTAGRGLMGGMLGGLLAGGLFAWMLGNGAFEGLQLMDILLVAGLAFLVIRMLKGSQSQARSHAQAAGASLRQPVGEQPMNDQSHHSGFSRMMNAEQYQQPMNLPTDFNKQVFISAALQHYRTVQQAWNDGDMEKIREYVAPELFDALARQRQDMADAPPRTEVLDLTADIVRADQMGHIRQISVLFRGRSRDLGDHSENGIFDTWHLQRDMSDDNSPWLVIGIEAE